MNSKLAWVYNKFQETLDYRVSSCLTSGKKNPPGHTLLNSVFSLQPLR